MECYLEVSFTLRESTSWAKAGHEVAFGQVQLVKPKPLQLLKEMSLAPPIGPRCTQISPQILEIRSLNTDTLWKFNVVHGSLFSWKKSGSELIHTTPSLDFYRAVTDNDRPSRFGQSWINSRLHQTKCHVRSVTWSKSNDSGDVSIVVVTRIAPPVLEWSIDTTFTYTFTNKYLSIKVAGEPRGMNLPNTFARVGLTLSLNDVAKASWFGRGPGESYRDKKRSQKFGTYSLPIDDLFIDYEFPQETGNRTDVRWVEFVGKDTEKRGSLLKASFGDLEEASFSALHYETRDLDECQHPYELYRRRKGETRCQVGLGASWARNGELWAGNFAGV